MIEQQRGEIERYHKKSGWKLYLFILFVVVLGVVLYGSFSDSINLTGWVIGNSISLSGNGTEFEPEGIDFGAELDVPETEVDGRFSDVEIVGSSSGFLYAGNQKIDLGNVGRNFISFEFYDGYVEFDSGKILAMKGKAKEVNVNGIPFTSASNRTSTIKVSLNGDFGYESLKFSDDVRIKELNYITSGMISLENGKTTITLDNEKVVLKDFYGSLNSEKGVLKLDGLIKEVSVSGENRISVG